MEKVYINGSYKVNCFNGQLNSGSGGGSVEGDIPSDRIVDADTIEFKTSDNKVELCFDYLNGDSDSKTLTAATTEKAGIMSAQDKKRLNTNTQELFPETLIPNFRDVEQPAYGSFNRWYGFSTSEDNVSGLLVAIDFGAAPASTKTWQYRLGKKVRDASGAITGLTTVQGSEGTIVIQAGETRAYLPKSLRFEKDYVLELYFAAITSDENLLYKSNATDSYYIRFVDGVTSAGSMYQINAVIEPVRSDSDEVQDEVHIKSKN